MTAPKPFRKKPVIIDAIRFVDTTSAGIIIGWTWAAGDPAHYVEQGVEHPMRYEHEEDRGNGHTLDTAPAFLVIPTLEGDHRADEGDWIVRGVKGEFYPVKPGIFDLTYEAVAE